MILGSFAGQALATGASNTILGQNANVTGSGRQFCVVLGRSGLSPAVDGSLSIGATGANAMNNLVLGAAGAATGTYLNIYLNGTNYKIALLNP